MKIVYARKFDHILPNVQDAEGVNISMTASRIGSVPMQDAQGNWVESEVFLIDAPQAVHNIITEWAGYEYVATKEDVKDA